MSVFIAVRTGRKDMYLIKEVSLDVRGSPVDVFGFTIKSRQDAFEAFAKTLSRI